MQWRKQSRNIHVISCSNFTNAMFLVWDTWALVEKIRSFKVKKHLSQDHSPNSQIFLSQSGAMHETVPYIAKVKQKKKKRAGVFAPSVDYILSARSLCPFSRNL